MQHTTLKAECVTGARSKPPVEVDRTVLICTAIRPFPQRHVLRAFTPMTIAFVDDRQFFPKAQTLMCKRLLKAVGPQSLYTKRLRICRLRLSFGASFAAAVIWERSVGSIGDQAQRCPLVGSYHVLPEAAQQEAHR